MKTGGLSTDIKSLKANLFLSATVAFIGISAPIGLSFALRGLLNITPLQAFAAGAALCSTSLGTTFTVLSTSGLSESRLGVVLTSAAMMDDVVGLVMVQVISNLGGASSFDWVTVVRPVGVSIAFATILPLLCVLVVKPLTASATNTCAHGVLSNTFAAFVFNTAVLLALVTGSSYAGTSNLFAAYLAGACTSWWDGVKFKLHGEEQSRAVPTVTSHSHSGPQPRPGGATSTAPEHARQGPSPSRGIETYEKYYGPIVRAFLKPLFFASIGFSIPVSRMFEGGIIWRGLVYTALMAVGKLVCGLCLVRFAASNLEEAAQGLAACRPSYWKTHHKDEIERMTSVSTPVQQDGGAQEPPSVKAADDDTVTSTTNQANTSRKRSKLPKPRSLYPAAILGSAMMARGEIGFLISSVAHSNGIFNSQTQPRTSELFLVVTWAILLCTILGPVTVGLLVKRVKRLQALERRNSAGRDDPLGIWGVILTT